MIGAVLEIIGIYEVMWYNQVTGEVVAKDKMVKVSKDANIEPSQKLKHNHLIGLTRYWELSYNYQIEC